MKVPFKRVRTPASGAPSARMRRGLVTSMVVFVFTWWGIVVDEEQNQKTEIASNKSHVIDNHCGRAVAWISCSHSPHSTMSRNSPEQLCLGRLCLCAMPSMLDAGYSNLGNQPAVLPMPWSRFQSLMLTLQTAFLRINQHGVAIFLTPSTTAPRSANRRPSSCQSDTSSFPIFLSEHRRIPVATLTLSLLVQL